MNRFLILFAITGLALAGCGKSSDLRPSSDASGGQKPLIAFLPKSRGNAYFISCKKGADKAAKDLGIELIFDAPSNPDPAKQNEIIETWTTMGVDAIAAACENKEGISTALRKARAKGIKVVTFDADGLPDARDFFVNQATEEGIGNALMDEAARLTESEGEFAIIVGSVTATRSSGASASRPARPKSIPT